MNKIELRDFNNLTKTLTFNIYDICYTRTARQQAEYIRYIDEKYNAARLTEILKEVNSIIGATILNIAHQDYEPQGASVNFLICEEPLVQNAQNLNNSKSPSPLPDAILAHLDKSHISVHTYPESHPDSGISSFRVDIDVSTCGQISPLKALNFLIYGFDSDIVMLDYRIRGFTRDVSGQKHFMDHAMHSIQSFLSEDSHKRYQMMDMNIPQERNFHTKMLRKAFNLEDYLFETGAAELGKEEKKDITWRLQQEMQEIFYGQNYS